MIGKVILVISLLQICAGDDSEQPQSKSNQAVSSQSFVRHDVPLSYKYSAVHIYTTAKPEQYKEKTVNSHGREHLKEIQYAPIFNTQYDANNVKSQEDIQNPVDSAPNKVDVTLNPKHYLEPKPQLFQSLEYPQDHLTYVPGYNVELLQAVNRYPGHNAVYRSYPHMSPHEKINKVNYLNQYVPYQKQEKEYLTTYQPLNNSDITDEFELTTVTLSPFVPPQPKPIRPRSKHHKFIRPVPKPALYNTPNIAALKAGPLPQNLLTLQELIPHPKAHRMLLNIARTYNIANTAQQEPHASLTMLKNLPIHTQAIIQIPIPANIDKNTRLLPIQNMPKLNHQLV